MNEQTKRGPSVNRSEALMLTAGGMDLENMALRESSQPQKATFT